MKAETILNDDNVSDFMTEAARRACRDLPLLRSVAIIFAWDAGGNQNPDLSLGVWTTSNRPGRDDPKAILLTMEQLQKFHLMVLEQFNRYACELRNEILRLEREHERLVDEQKEITSARPVKTFHKIFEELESTLAKKADSAKATDRGGGQGSNDAPELCGDQE